MAQFAYIDEILKRERGLNCSAEQDIPPSSHKLKIRVRFTKTRIIPDAYRSSLRRRSAINAISWQEDFMIILNSDGVLSIFISESPSRAQAITKPHEKAIKFFIKQDALFYFSKLNTESFTRFYKLNLHQLRTGQVTRERLLRFTRFPPVCLKSIDSSNLKVIAIENDFFEVWDLESQSLQFRSSNNTWYSRNYVVETTNEPSGTLFTLTNLHNMERSSIMLNGFNRALLHLEVIHKHLVICFGRVLVIDIKERKMYNDYGTPKLYLETNVMKDLFLISEDKTASFVFSNSHSISLDTANNPVFCDTEDTIVLYDSGRVSIIHKNYGLLSVSRVNVRQTVNCIAVNENISEVFLGCENGQVIVLEKN